MHLCSAHGETVLKHMFGGLSKDEYMSKQERKRLRRSHEVCPPVWPRPAAAFAAALIDALRLSRPTLRARASPYALCGAR